MKIVVCGPPHSGKSVFIGSLRHYLPTSSLRYIAANGDGEGDWSNNPDTQDVQSVRRKGSNDEIYMERWKENIIGAKQNIVLVDIGGRLQDDKIRFFEACDYFIVVSSNVELKENWVQFGERNGCKCLASLDSRLNGPEEIHDDGTVIKGTLSGLNRGSVLLNSDLIRMVADRIIAISGHHEEPEGNNETWDFNKIAETLGFYRNYRHDDNGQAIFSQYFEPQKASTLYDYLNSLYNNSKVICIYNARANWVTGLAVGLLHKKNVGCIKYYYTLANRYITIRKPETTSADTSSPSLKCEKQTFGNSTCLQFEIALNYELTLDDYERWKLPEVNDGTRLFLSGRIPNFMIASMVITYSNACEIYVRQPGIGYICCYAHDISKLGEILNSEHSN